MHSHFQKHKTCKRWNEPGHAHELTFSCFHGLSLLSKDRTRTWFVEAVDRSRRRHDFDLWAYVIMPEHVHLLIHPRRGDYDMSIVLSAIKWPVAIQAKRHLERHAPEWLPRLTDVQPNGRSSVRFWQRGGGYDRNVPDDRALGAMIEYIHANPVRRDLVATPSEWRWSRPNGMTAYAMYLCEWMTRSDSIAGTPGGMAAALSGHVRQSMAAQSRSHATALAARPSLTPEHGCPKPQPCHRSRPGPRATPSPAILRAGRSSSARPGTAGP